MKKSNTKKSTAKTPAYVIPHWIQLLLVTGGSLLLASSLYFSISGFILFSGDDSMDTVDKLANSYATALPVMFTLVAYLFNPRGLNVPQRLLESLFVAAGGLFILQWGSFLETMLYSRLDDNILKANLIVNLSITAVFALVLYAMRATKRWK